MRQWKLSISVTWLACARHDDSEKMTCDVTRQNATEQLEKGDVDTLVQREQGPNYLTLLSARTKFQVNTDPAPLNQNVGVMAPQTNFLCSRH